MPCFPGDRMPFGSSACLIAPVKTHQRVIVEVVLRSSEVHEREMRAVLAVAGRARVFNQRLHQIARAARLGRVVAIENGREHVVHVALTRRKAAVVVEAELRGALAHHAVLPDRITSGRRDRPARNRHGRRTRRAS